MASRSADVGASLQASERSAWLVAYLFLWTVIAIVAATTAFIALRGQTLQYWFSIATIMFSFFYIWGAISLLVVGLLIRFPVSRRNFWMIGPMHALLLILFSVCLPFVVHGADWRDWLYGSRAAGWHALNAIIYSFVLIGFQMLQYYRLGLLRERDAQKAELRSVQLEKDLGQARMDTLRIQMNPHFLFNALNSISSLISTSNNNEAFRMTGLLGALLRAALEQTGNCFTTLRDELAFLQKYIDIEKVRFDDRLKINRDIPSGCLDLPVPSLMLQPIVENVIKHAVSRTSNPVAVDLTATCDGGRLALEVADDGPGLLKPVVFGCGLKNISERLALLYGNDATLTISNRASGGALVRVVIPVAGAAQQAAPAVRKEKRQLAN